MTKAAPPHGQRAIECGATDDDRFGLPILRARWHLIAEDLTSPAVIASDRRHSIGRPDFIPPNPWRYEVFALPPAPARDGWASWESQQADPLLRAEADRQNTWLAISLALRGALEDGELEGYGRRDDLAGEWQAIPRDAWRLLRVPFDYTFGNWRVGHAVGAGLDLWGVRILDRAGLLLRAAALAYGPVRAAAIAQQSRARAACGVEGHDVDLDERETTEGTTSGAIASAAENELNISLRRRLIAGELLALGRKPDRSIARIEATEWRTGLPDFAASTLRSHLGLHSDVVVRPPHPTAVDSRVPGSARSTSPMDSDVVTMAVSLFQEAKQRGEPVPKSDWMKTAWRDQVGATTDQVKAALRNMPDDLRRGRGKKG